MKGEKFKMENNALQHHGIKGMKWGIRRTPEQLSRMKGRIDTTSGIVKEAKNINDSVSNIRSITAKKQDLSKMTDQELRDRVNRMNLEQQFSQLSSRKISKGEQYVKNTLEIAGNTLAVAGSAVAIAVGIQQLRNKI